jgi:hypothetical protein
MSSSKIIAFPSHARPRLVPDQVAAPHEANSPLELSSPPHQVTFRRAFLLPGMDGPHAPGTFAVVETREPLDVMWEAYRVSRQILLSGNGGLEAHDVTSADLEEALARDLSHQI